MGIELAKAFITITADQSQLLPQLQKVRALTTGVLSTGIGLAADLESATLQFSTVLGSAEAAQDLLIDLRDFAAKTPFELVGLRNAAKTLLNFGIQLEDVMDRMKILGDIASSADTDLNELAIIFGKVQSTGRLMGDTFNQLIERGINFQGTLAEVAEVARKDLRDAISRGEISAAELTEAFRRMASEGGNADNAMEKLSTTLKGLQSTLADTMAEVQLTIGETLVPMMKLFTGEAINMFEALGGFIKANKFAVAATIVTTDAVTKLAGAIALLRIAVIGLGISLTSVLVTGGIGLGLIAIGASIGILIDQMNQMNKVIRDWEKTWKTAILTIKLELSKLADHLHNAFVSMLPGKQFRKDFDKELGKLAPSQRTKDLEKELGNVYENSFEEFFAKKFKNTFQRAMGGTGKKAAEEMGLGIEPAVKPGFVGFAELGRRVQEALIKQQDPMQAKMVSLLEAQKQLQSEIAQNTRPTGTVALGLS